jgi:hypothetical protein
VCIAALIYVADKLANKTWLVFLNDGET